MHKTTIALTKADLTLDLETGDAGLELLVALIDTGLDGAEEFGYSPEAIAAATALHDLLKSVLNY